MGSERVEPRLFFAPVWDGHIWVEFASNRAKDARAKWCHKTGETWAQWRKKRPGLRIVRCVATPEGGADGE